MYYGPGYPMYCGYSNNANNDSFGWGWAIIIVLFIIFFFFWGSGNRGNYGNNVGF